MRQPADILPSSAGWRGEALLQDVSAVPLCPPPPVCPPLPKCPSTSGITTGSLGNAAPIAQTDAITILPTRKAIYDRIPTTRAEDAGWNVGCLLAGAAIVVVLLAALVIAGIISDARSMEGC